MLRLRTLGGLSIENGASIGGAAASRRPLALLALLAVNGGRGLSRDTIVALLWPESDTERGRNSLSQLISVLRRELATDDLLLGTAELRVNPEVLICDVTEFEDRIAADDLEAATRLYTGPFLDGVFLKNTPEFERWADQQRARLQHVQGDALERLAARATANGEDVSAVRLWRQLASLAPSDSRVARSLMESLVAAGDRAGALAHYRVHDALLRDDVGVEPDATLVEYAASVRDGNDRPAHAPRDSTVALVRRDGPSRDEPAQLEALSPSTTVVATRKRVLLPMAAVAMLVVGVAAGWSAKSGRFGFGPPKPPAHDTLRLRIVTASARSDQPSDSMLAQAVRNTVLAELAKDPWLFVVEPAAWVAYAPLIGLNAAVLALPDTVRKYARKARTHAIVDFFLSQTPNGFVITAEARSASTDSSLGVITVGAAGPVDLPDAMLHLGHALRERLVAARSTLPPTKWSLNTTDQTPQAVAAYVEARSEFGRRNWIEAARRAGVAVRIDSTFAQAWQLRYAALANAQLWVDDQLNAISTAFRFRSRLRSPYNRLGIAATYFRVIGDPDRSVVYYDSISRLAPQLPNTDVALAYRAQRKFDLAIRAYRGQIDSTHRYIWRATAGLVATLLSAGNKAEAQLEVARLFRADSANPTTLQARAFVFAGLRNWDSLGVLGKSYLGVARTASDSALGLEWAGEVAISRGRFANFDSMARLTATLVEKNGSPGDYLAWQLNRARLRAILAGDTARARAIADSGLAVARFESLKPMDRPYLVMLLYLASVGDVKRGADVARAWSRDTPTEYRGRDSLNVLVGRGELALADGNAREALRLFRIADVRDCDVCFYPRYGRAFDAMGERDSARVWFEKYAVGVAPRYALDDIAELAHTYLRLGELNEERREVSAAITWYDQFTNLWATADAPALQASVRQVRGRADRLRKQGR